jgi:hypothetical protein
MNNLLQINVLDSIFTVQNFYTFVLVLIAFITWKITVDNKISTLNVQISTLKIEIKEVQGLYTKITNLDTNSQLMKQDLEYLKKDYDIQIKATEKMKDDIHLIKGSLLTIEHYFKNKND